MTLEEQRRAADALKKRLRTLNSKPKRRLNLTKNRYAGGLEDHLENNPLIQNGKVGPGPNAQEPTCMSFMRD